ncbi:Putative F-box only protein [Septoria linicola]|uniref:F-box only protein n=1 Tax=Septoria linicola TaxID=215465 RepID=A0A9Q9ALP5_9PEZI|nr:putative F-box only protein [Septoria linicola]USW49268.1 Putative F-box only protein [Septoria linicola]
MERLPEEIILHVLSYLDVVDLVRVQLVSVKFLTLGRDDALWKIVCYDHSQAERIRRRRDLLNSQDPRLAEIRNAVSALPSSDLPANNEDRSPGFTAADPAAQVRLQRIRAIANWEPGYPSEHLDYYDEYIQRHGAINVGWIDLPNSHTIDRDDFREVTGIGLLSDRQDRTAEHAVAALDDGSVCLWNLAGRRSERSSGGGRLLAQSRPGLLTGQGPEATSKSHTSMTETGAVECVTVDSSSGNAYFAVQNSLQEVDLTTLQVVSAHRYPFPITALSESRNRSPLTVGTNSTIHLHDPRGPSFAPGDASTGGELIGGSLYSHATLTQPGPLSILHQDTAGTDSSIWVAGRFTSLLNYDRRFFPRLRGTIFSGARIAYLATLPQPWVPRSLDLIRHPHASLSALQTRKDAVGSTIIAAAEYKGKGSLEFYPQPSVVEPYRNRQNASASKLLSVASHGGRIVFSDGDGHLKWMERDGSTYVRTYNINDSLPVESDTASQDSAPRGIFTTSGTEVPGQGDIVQKILPLGQSFHEGVGTGGRLDINQNKLLLWTGDGRLGVLGMGHGDPLGRDEWHDALEEQALSAAEKARQDAERQYGMAMRRALERNADEVRFVRGLGMGFTR